MRPRRLTMTAFGPYKDTTVINFQELKGNPLFVISGNTGAGKTTIFDGICYALYGSASGEDREVSTMLRSQFASDDTHTAVELVFELKNREYRIKRQLGHIKAGNKTKTGEDYEFYQLTDDGEIPCVDRQIVSEINKKVESLLGLTQDQFKQIVMLPQGEFRKLLTSETENKEDILRRLFKTEPYKLISERLRQRKNHVQDEFTAKRQTRDTYVQNIAATLPERDESTVFDLLTDEEYNVYHVLTGLDDEIHFYEEQIKHDQERYDQAYVAHTKEQEAFHQAKALNERFQELETKTRQLDELEKKRATIAEQEKVLQQAEKAKQLEPYEKQVRDWHETEQQKQATMNQAVKALADAEKTLAQSTKNYEIEADKKNEREETAKQLDRLESFLPTVKQINDQEQQLALQKQEETKLRKQLTDKQTKKQEVKQRLDAENETIQSLDAMVSVLPEKYQQLENMRAKCRVLDRYLKCATDQTTLTETLEAKKQLFINEQQTYQSMEETWLNNQATVLAGHLHAGEPCPVCGSHEHPMKASLADDGVTKEQLEKAKQQLETADAAYRVALAKAKANEEQLANEKQEMANIDLSTEQAAKTREQLVTSGKQLKETVDELEKSRTRLQELKTNQTTWQQTWNELDEAERTLQENQQKVSMNYQQALGSYQAQIAQIPETLRDLTALEKQINETTTHKKQLETAWETAQQHLQQAKNKQTEAITNDKQAKQQLAETVAKKEQAEQQFREKLTETDFDTADGYQQAKREESDRQQLKQTIETYYQALNTLTQQVHELKGELQNKQKADLNALNKQLTTLRKAYEQALHQRDQSKKYEQEARQLSRQITNAHESVRAIEKKLGVIADLYDVLRGQNSQKISFERYLQIEYLDQIIDAANQRLNRLSNGQFLLIRSERQESHGKQSGLGLDVYDAYTGQTRDVKTMSGGEKFNASLCLALGMSDVVQSFQGNISIETMFIDEGFGSLDEESLHKAIDALIDIQQSGRMIGVISHVQELKDLFPAVLEVEKTKEGHSQASFMVK